MNQPREQWETVAIIFAQLFAQAEQRTAETQANLQAFTEALAVPVECEKEES